MCLGEGIGCNVYGSIDDEHHHAHTVNDLLPREHKLTSLESVAAIRPHLSHDFVELMKKGREEARRISIKFQAKRIDD